MCIYTCVNNFLNRLYTHLVDIVAPRTRSGSFKSNNYIIILINGETLDIFGLNTTKFNDFTKFKF